MVPSWSRQGLFLFSLLLLSISIESPRRLSVDLFDFLFLAKIARHLIRKTNFVVQLYTMFVLGALLFDIFELFFKRDSDRWPVTLASQVVFLNLERASTQYFLLNVHQ